jgi:peptidoglycan/xylan/chitin deacetylase (PgdA/CDA1 family)
MEWLIRKIAPINKVTIIMFHAVGDNKTMKDFPARFNLYTSKEIFEKKIKFFKRYNIILFTDLLNSFEKKHLPLNSIVITFDDGYVHKDAFEVLKKHNVPSTIFLTTNYISANTILPLNELYYCIMNTKKYSISLLIPGRNKEEKFDLIGRKAKRIAVTRLSEIFKDLPQEQRLELIEQIKQMTGIRYRNETENDFRMLTWEEIIEMKKSNLIEFGSHTKTHCILSKAAEDQVYRELKESKEMIEKMVGVEIKLFAYPNGKKNDYTEHHIEMLKGLGYEYACTTQYGFNDLNTNPFELKRIGYNYPNYFLACKMLFHSKSRKYA